jgi:hypothetical protein
MSRFQCGGGSIGSLAAFLNLASNNDYVLVVASQVSAVFVSVYRGCFD